MKEFRPFFILLIVVLGIFTIAHFYVRYNTPRTVDIPRAFLDSLRQENMEYIKYQDARIESLTIAVWDERDYQQELLQTIQQRNEIFKTEYRKNTLRTGYALDSAFAESLKRIVANYESGKYDPDSNAGDYGTRTEP